MERNTIQRALTLEAVKELKCHTTADEVYASVAKKHPTISRGTVYRNLNQLAADGEITGVKLPGNAKRYDCRRDSHYHAQCLKCGKVVDVDMDYNPDLISKINNSNGFCFSGYDLVFKGVCAECKKAEEPAKNDEKKGSKDNEQDK